MTDELNDPLHIHDLPRTSPGRPETAEAASAHEAPIAFCQQCGRGLTPQTLRRYGASILCEPCATVRSAQAAGWQPVNGPNSPPTGTIPGPVSVADSLPTGNSGEPNPRFAGLLGLIPGVGAMYNGQYAKGALHLIVFVVLVSLADNLNWVFYWLVWGWIFYQAFDAYHTAQARRDGLPLPNPFGWNEVGERFGMHRSAGSSAPFNPRHHAPASPAPFPAPTQPAAPGTPAYTPVAMGASVPVHPFVHPAAAPAQEVPLASAYVPPSAGIPTQPPPAPGNQYTATFSGIPSQAAPAPGTPSQGYSFQDSSSFPQNGAAGGSRFPVVAAILIGLGALFLFGNLLPSWHLSGRWLLPVLLTAVALWVGMNHVLNLREASPAGTVQSFAAALLGPALVLSFALLLTLQDAAVLPLRHSWPALLIVWGIFLAASRAAGPPAPAPLAGQPVASAPAAEPASTTSPARA